MKAFLVSVNGKRFALAGVGGHGVLTAAVTSITGRKLEGRGKLPSRLELYLGGLNTSSREHLRWHRRGPVKLRVGDEIKIRIVNAETVDEPLSRYAPAESKGRGNGIGRKSKARQ
jgi:hypothetical protein